MATTGLAIIDPPFKQIARKADISPAACSAVTKSAFVLKFLAYASSLLTTALPL